MRKKLIRCAVVAVAMIIMLGIATGDHKNQKRSYDGRNVTTTWKRDINDADLADVDSATVMIYMIGSDLESEGGCASLDLEEILASRSSEDVDIVIQTGGALEWQNPDIDDGMCERFLVSDGELVLEENLGQCNMSNPDTLSEFIQWTAEHHSADRYDLILWDHGGGTMNGYGADEIYPDSVLSLYDIQQALETSDVHMDFVGFDACLMGTIETAYMLSDYADYLIASEETEPGSGWYYTDWLTLFGEKVDISTELLGKKIVEDYMYGSDGFFADSMTLSVIRLSEIPALYETLCDYLKEAEVKLRAGSYEDLAQVRGKALSLGEGEFDQIDIADYVGQTSIEESALVLSALEDAVAYTDSNISGTNGLAMFFPYVYPEYYEETKNIIETIGMDDEAYADFFDDFVNVMVYGQSVVSESASPIEELTGYSEEPQTDYTDASWYDDDVEQWYDGSLQVLDSGELYLTEKGEGFVLSLTDEEWDTITYMELEVYIDDGEGYLELGNDNVYEFDEDGDLAVDFDYMWVCINDQVVPFYAETEGTRADGSWYTYGYVPAELNHEKDIELIVYWDEENPDGHITGYRPAASDDDGTNLANRATYQFEAGDEIDFYCDYYSYDGDYDASYYVGDTILYDGSALNVSYAEIEDYDTLICYHIIDLYQNEYWTEFIELSMGE